MADKLVGRKFMLSESTGGLAAYNIEGRETMLRNGEWEVVNCDVDAQLRPYYTIERVQKTPEPLYAYTVDVMEILRILEPSEYEKMMAAKEREDEREERKARKAASNGG